MAIERLSGAAYQNQNLAGLTTPKTEMMKGQGVDNGINISEVSGTTGAEKEEKSKQNNEQKDGQTTDKQIKDAVNNANSKLKMHRTRCEFSYHEDTKRVSIKVLDNDTHEIIREIPPEETLQMVEKMWELAGLLVDEKR